VAAAYTGHAFRRATRALGDKPSRAEVAFEVTYRAPLVPWLSIQADLQYVLDPGGLRSRSDALVGILRYVVEI
jgi:porin